MFLFEDSANRDVAGKTFLFNPSAKIGSVHAHISYTDPEGRSHTESLVQHFTLQLRFRREARILSAHIYWCGPDPARSFIAGQIAIRRSGYWGGPR